jgi:hypothetical protein
MNIAERLAAIAAKVGAPVIKGLLQATTPGVVSDIGGRIIDEIAGQAGVSAEQLPDILESNPRLVESAVVAIEADMPRLIALWEAGIQGQFALLQAETQKGGWDSAWRWGWMYLLGFFWLWLIVVVPVLNLMLPDPGLVMTVSVTTVLTLTSWFIALYMGGHTLKELGTNIRDAFVGRTK